ncbi:MAG: hypothetical protein P8J37_03940 [Fuerstiella sp.]|nr:hypothetical protein [Fuerstiella sp.]
MWLRNGNTIPDGMITAFVLWRAIVASNLRPMTDASNSTGPAMVADSATFCQRTAALHRETSGTITMKRLACACLLLMSSTGCQGLMHELQPHRLWRMNYQEPVGRTDNVYFSVDDPLDEPIASSALNYFNDPGASSETSVVR